MGNVGPFEGEGLGMSFRLRRWAGWSSPLGELTALFAISLAGAQQIAPTHNTVQTPNTIETKQPHSPSPPNSRFP
eukprot:1822477-Amphidinium_carterae.1